MNIKKFVNIAFPLGIITYAIIKGKKLYDSIDDVEREEEEQLNSSGISTEELKKNIQKDETDFVKMFFVSSYNNPRFETSIFDTGYLNEEDYDENFKDEEETLEVKYNQASRGIVHVKQQTHKGKRFLSFELDIPTAYENNKVFSYNYPKFNVFRESILELRRKLETDVVKITHISRINCIGKVFYTNIDENGNPSEGFKCFVIPKSVYCKDGEQDWDKLNEFLKEEVKALDAAQKNDDRYLPDWFFEASKLKKEDVYSLEDIESCFTLTFPIRSTNPGEEIGIDLITATECLSQITDDFSVIRGDKRSNNLEYLYRHVIFHPVDENGNSLEENCYEIDEEGKLKNTWLYY